MGNNSQSWKKQLTGLSNQFTVIAWDAPGYGKSSDPKVELREFKQFADVLKGFIEKLNYETVTLLGHSMGSAIALDFCYRFPDKVDALIISDATRGAAALSKEENERRLNNRLNNIELLEPEELAKLRVKELFSPQPDPGNTERGRKNLFANQTAGIPLGGLFAFFLKSNGYSYLR